MGLAPSGTVVFQEKLPSKPARKTGSEGVPVLGSSVGFVEPRCPPPVRAGDPRALEALPPPRLMPPRGADRPPPPHQPKAIRLGDVPTSSAAAATEIARYFLTM